MSESTSSMSDSTSHDNGESPEPRATPDISTLSPAFIRHFHIGNELNWRRGWRAGGVAFRTCRSHQQSLLRFSFAPLNQVLPPLFPRSQTSAKGFSLI